MILPYVMLVLAAVAVVLYAMTYSPQFVRRPLRLLGHVPVQTAEFVYIRLSATETSTPLPAHMCSEVTLINTTGYTVRVLHNDVVKVISPRRCNNVLVIKTDNSERVSIHIDSEPGAKEKHFVARIKK